MSQETTAGAAVDSVGELEQVVVTARRRAEALADVPVAVSVLSAAALETRGIKTEADLQLAMPGVVVRSSNNSNQLNYVIRGESVDAYSGSPPGVQPYINEVPFPVMSSTPFYDLQSVQAVKGPQGTLFGRNSTGGAVLFQTATPGSEFGGYAVPSIWQFRSHDQRGRARRAAGLRQVAGAFRRDGDVGRRVRAQPLRQPEAGRQAGALGSHHHRCAAVRWLEQRDDAAAGQDDRHQRAEHRVLHDSVR